MGEEAATKQEEVNNKEEEKVVEEKKEEEEEEKPALPFVLFVDLHCVGCAKKIERSIMKIRGVEAVTIDMAKNEVTIKGIVDPEAVCNKITKRTKRRTKVLSPLPSSEGEPIPQLITSQVSGPVTVELNVNMHCEPCADQLKTKILKMRGVQTAITELSTGKVTVTGTMDANKLVDYVYRRTKKQATIVPQPEPEPEPKPEPEPEPEKKDEESKEAEKPSASEEAKPEEKGVEKPAEEEAKKEDDNKNDEEVMKKELGGEENIDHHHNNNTVISDNYHHNHNHNYHEEHMNRMMMYQYNQPLYMIERIPPPQLFSDENPNACCIS